MIPNAAARAREAMNPAAIPDRCDGATLRAAAQSLNHGQVHGSITHLARVTGTPLRTMQAYASSARPVPRHLVASVRNLLALRALAATKGDAA